MYGRLTAVCVAIYRVFFCRSMLPFAHRHRLKVSIPLSIVAVRAQIKGVWAVL